MNDNTKKYVVDICKNSNPVVLVDVFNHLFKYYFANKGLSVNIDGVEYQTGHYYGFTKEMMFIREKFPNSVIVLVIDGHDPTRREINPEYKAGRVHEFEPMDIMGDILKLCSLIDNIYICFDKSYEADDGVCSISKHIKFLCDKHNIEKQIYILSTDKDMYQLISDEGSCKVSSIRKWGSGDAWLSGAEVVNEDKVRETFNDVLPKDLLKFRALTGDSSDNLKGYYRFRKANASIIANNYDYNEEAEKLVLKDGVERHASWDKFMKTVEDDMSVFIKNYKVMKMKYFEYDLEKLSDRVNDVDSVLDIARKYEMFSYIKSVGDFSKFKDDIDRYNERYDNAEDSDFESTSIEEMGDINLEELLM